MNKMSLIKKLAAYRRQVIRGLMLASLLIVFSAVVKKVGNVEKTELISTEGRTFEKACNGNYQG